MLMLTKTHAAVVAAKDAEIETLRNQASDAWAAYCGADAEALALRIRLAPFIGIRPRNSKGHFISAKGASAC